MNEAQNLDRCGGPDFSIRLVIRSLNPHLEGHTITSLHQNVRTYTLIGVGPALLIDHRPAFDFLQSQFNQDFRNAHPVWLNRTLEVRLTGCRRCLNQYVQYLQGIGREAAERNKLPNIADLQISRKRKHEPEDGPTNKRR